MPATAYEFSAADIGGRARKLANYKGKVLLIVNTMRVAAFSRRRETSIMRLVGASNFYIQLPFLLEAALAAARLPAGLGLQAVFFSARLLLSLL